MKKYLIAAILTGILSTGASYAQGSSAQSNKGLSTNPEYYGLDESGVTLGSLSPAAGGNARQQNNSNPEYYSQEADSTKVPLELLSTAAGTNYKARKNNSNPEYYTSESVQ